MKRMNNAVRHSKSELYVAWSLLHEAYKLNKVGQGYKNNEKCMHIQYTRTEYLICKVSNSVSLRWKCIYKHHHFYYIGLYCILYYYIFLKFCFWTLSQYLPEGLKLREKNEVEKTDFNRWNLTIESFRIW